MIDDVNLEKVFSLHILSLVKTNEKSEQPNKINFHTDVHSITTGRA